MYNVRLRFLVVLGNKSISFLKGGVSFLKNEKRIYFS